MIREERTSRALLVATGETFELPGLCDPTFLHGVDDPWARAVELSEAERAAGLDREPFDTCNGCREEFDVESLLDGLCEPCGIAEDDAVERAQQRQIDRWNEEPDDD